MALFSFAADGSTQSRRYFGSQRWAMCLAAAGTPAGELLLAGVADGGVSVLEAGKLDLPGPSGYVARVPAR